VKCVIQRVRRASVAVGDELVSEIGAGLLVLAAVEKGDGEQVMRDAAKKIRELRIFSDDAGKMNRDVIEAGGAILAVSQFTLAGSIARGRRPSFENAEEPERAHYVRAVRSRAGADRHRGEDRTLPRNDDRVAGERRAGHVRLG
jgi:D-tyrosyl-tRNA(Tyr) deacylase